jgi:hypothetical protein
MLWKIVIVKLIVMFALFKTLFFSDTLYTEFSSNEERADFVASNLLKESK